MQIVGVLAQNEVAYKGEAQRSVLPNFGPRRIDRQFVHKLHPPLRTNVEITAILIACECRRVSLAEMLGYFSSLKQGWSTALSSVQLA